MNKILIVALFFALAICSYDSPAKCTGSTTEAHIIDTSSNEYSYNYDFDWTDEDEFPFKVPFTPASVFTGDNNDIIPMFVNASAKSKVNGKTYKFKKDDNNNLYISFDNEEKVKYSSLDDIKEYYGQRVFATFDGNVTNNVLSATLKGSANLGAEAEDVTRKFRKYFAYAVCTGANEVTVIVSNILATFNNGNYFSMSKILLISLALLFL